jgi:acyl carrier protein
MSRFEQIVSFIQLQVEPEFDPTADALTQVLDSVSLLQLVEFIDSELGVQLDMSSLTLDAFATVDTVVAMLAEHERLSA